MVTKAGTGANQQRTRRRMVRKQVYILPSQDEQLKHLAQQRETTEAELIRGAIDELIRQESLSPVKKTLPPDQGAWQALLDSMRNLHQTALSGKPHRWTRADYYDDDRSLRLYGQGE